MICWKIRIFAYWTTPQVLDGLHKLLLWFAEKFVSLLIEQHHAMVNGLPLIRCDLLKNSYLCLLNNTPCHSSFSLETVVICWKIRIFAYWTTPAVRKVGRRYALWFAEKFVSLLIEQHPSWRQPTCASGCDLLKNSYLCLLNNTPFASIRLCYAVVICWKIRIFAYWTTPPKVTPNRNGQLWFAEKFVSLLIEQHLIMWK